MRKIALKQLCKAIAILQLLLFASTVMSADSDVFQDHRIGLTLKKPATWTFVGNDAITDNRNKIRFNDVGLGNEIKARGARPFVVALQHPEPWPDLNASFQIGIHPLGEYKSKFEVDFCNTFIPGYAKAYKDFKIQTATRIVTVSKIKACRLSFQYFLQTTDGGGFPIWSDLIVVPRGNFFFAIKMGRAPNDQKVAKALEGALNTIQIDQ